MHPDPTDADAPTAVVTLLQFLVSAGEGAVLGLASPGQSRLRRVSRPTADFAERFAAAYQEQYSALTRFAAARLGDRQQAEDVVQRAYEAVWRSQCARPRSIENIAAYLVTAVAHEVQREPRVPATYQQEPPELHGPDPTRLRAEALTLRDELRLIPRREREAVVLRIQWQLTVTETAQTMGVSEGAVKRYTYDGLKRLRARLGDVALGA